MTSSRRDRRGRGLRGPLLTPTVPAYRTRRQRFDDLVAEVAGDVRAQWEAILEDTEFGVEDVPPSDPAPWEPQEAVLGRCFAGGHGHPTRVVVYRRPVESRAADPGELVDLVRSVVVEQVASLIARTPEEVADSLGW